MKKILTLSLLLVWITTETNAFYVWRNDCPSDKPYFVVKNQYKTFDSPAERLEKLNLLHPILVRQIPDFDLLSECLEKTDVCVGLKDVLAEQKIADYFVRLDKAIGQKITAENDDIYKKCKEIRTYNEKVKLWNSYRDKTNVLNYISVDKRYTLDQTDGWIQVPNHGFKILSKSVPLEESWRVYLSNIKWDREYNQKYIQHNLEAERKNREIRQKNQKIEKENKKRMARNKIYEEYFTPELVAQLEEDYDNRCVGCTYPDELRTTKGRCDLCLNREFTPAIDEHGFANFEGSDLPMFYTKPELMGDTVLGNCRLKNSEEKVEK